MLWKTRGVRRLLKLGAKFVDCDMCQYSRQYKKATKLLVWGPAFDNIILRKCDGRMEFAAELDVNTLSSRER